MDPQSPQEGKCGFKFTSASFGYLALRYDFEAWDIMSFDNALQCKKPVTAIWIDIEMTDRLIENDYGTWINRTGRQGRNGNSGCDCGRRIVGSRVVSDE